MRLTKMLDRTGKCIRLISFCILLPLLLLVISACASHSIEGKNGDRPLVVTTIFPPYDFARNVAGEHADVEVLVDVTDSHSYSPTAMDMVLIEECDVFIYTGGDGDLWAEDFLSTIDCSDKIVINMLEIADALPEATLSKHDHEQDHDHGHEHAHVHDEEALVYDEHVWLSPLNAAKITSAIGDALSSVDADHMDQYLQSATEYSAMLDALDSALRSLVEEADSHTILVADRFPFLYLCETYGLSYYAALPGCSTASDLTAIEYEHLAEHLREELLPVIFTAEYSDGTIARTVRRESGLDGVEILSLHSCHTLTKGQIEEGQSYLTLMNENISALKKALG